MTKLQDLFKLYCKADSRCSCVTHSLEIADDLVCQREKLWRAYCRVRDNSNIVVRDPEKMSKLDLFASFAPNPEED